MQFLSESEFEIIRNCSLFSGLERSSLEKALVLLETERLNSKKGSIIHSTGSKFISFGLVLSGSVQACFDDIDGNRIIMAQITPGKTFGESLCFLGIADSPVSVIAAEDSSLLMFTPEIFLKDSCDSFTALLQRNFTALIASKALEMNNRIQILSKLSLRDKVMMFLNEEANKALSYDFCIHMNRESLAAYIASDRSSLSRTLSKLKAEGIIDYSGNRFRILKHK